jgi:hypothetical protein
MGRILNPARKIILITNQTTMKTIITTFVLSCSISAFAQTNPAITSWLQNTTTTGRHYVSGSSTPVTDATIANCQSVKYSTNNVYVSTKGIPTYITGPFLDGNPSLATSQNAIFKFPLSPTQNTGTLTATSAGNIGVFINGVALFDYRDGVSWKTSSQALAGGPLGGTGDGIWNRDAIVAEMGGFDCSKGHPAMGNYHHHQNPSAFNMDLVVVSTVCNLYTSDGLYVIDSTTHSPLIGFAYDGFPIYGAYGYKNVDGTGGITRMKSSYQLRNISVRTHYADGTDVTDGPAVSATYALGLFREDYEYIATTTSTPDYLDDHNGRYCVTPEYPNGTYAYFCTVDENWNSAYPYAVGPYFYGNKTAAKVTTITETTTTYTGTTTALSENKIENVKVSVFPNPASNLVAIQVGTLNKENYDVQLFDLTGNLISATSIAQGSTLAYFDTSALSAGEYLIIVTNGKEKITKKVSIER